MSDKAQIQDTSGQNQHAADQQHHDKNNLERDTLYRNLKQADDLFFELLSENYSAG